MAEEDHKKLVSFEKGDMKHQLFEMSDFEVNFPDYREKYLREQLPILKRVMKEQEIVVELDSMKGQMKVRTTKHTWDPYAIMKARDIIKLLARNVPIETAVKVFKDENTSDVISIRNMCRDGEIFKKRRDRLLGRDNKVLSGLQMLTETEVFVQGSTVACVGPYKGVKAVRNFVEKVMKNDHPLHLLQTLNYKKSLMNDESKAGTSWYVPSYTNRTIKKKKKARTEKEYNPFPPAPLESKEDKQVEEGEYFINESMKKKKKQLSRKELNEKSEKIQSAKRSAQFVAPKEPEYKRQKLEPTEEVDVGNLKKKVKDKTKKLEKSKKKTE